MNTLPDLSQLTHEQLLEFTRQLALQHQSLAQSNQELDQTSNWMPKFSTSFYSQSKIRA